MMITHRQMCSLEDAKSDFESVIKIKPNHSTAVKELAALSDLQTAFEQLQVLQQHQESVAATGGQQLDAAAARLVLDKIYSLAPDCIPAQLLDAQLEMVQGNYEQVGHGRQQQQQHSSIVAAGVCVSASVWCCCREKLILPE